MSRGPHEEGVVLFLSLSCGPLSSRPRPRPRPQGGPPRNRMVALRPFPTEIGPEMGPATTVAPQPPLVSQDPRARSRRCGGWRRRGRKEAPGGTTGGATPPRRQISPPSPPSPPPPRPPPAADGASDLSKAAPLVARRRYRRGAARQRCSHRHTPPPRAARATAVGAEAAVPETRRG